MADGEVVVKVDPDLADMIPGFLANRKRDAQAVRDAVASGDLATVRRLGHTLKGVGGGYGFPVVSEIGGEIEAAGLAGDPEAADAAARRLADYLAKVRFEC
jgi:HPt (histidine-containing phosphotransfer) domain-containing protein